MPVFWPVHWPVLWIVLIVLALSGAGYGLARRRALKSAGGDARRLHSRPVYHGAGTAIFTGLFSLLLLALWLIVQPIVVDSRIAATLDAGPQAGARAPDLVMADIRRIARGLDIAVDRGILSADEAASLGVDGRAPGNDADRVQVRNPVRAILAQVGVPVGSQVDPAVLEAAQRYRALTATGRSLMAIAVLAAALAGFAFAYLRTNRDHRARNVVERTIRALLLGAASIAIVTTIGIIASLIFNTVEFLLLYPAADFFLGTTWTPSFGGGSELGVLPLLWGTLYISLIALAVAVPIGLFTAIYLSEYASRAMRSALKPMIEVLAGIPTIVYGLFALLTVGPLLMGVFGPGGTGWMGAASSVMTAGLVMGIMLIPFVSSLSDDIINAVPQALRDGSLGLGATRSETIRHVILPAALPGIVGAVLLAASRAIGETMIVVLGAGAAARLSLNPFEAMTTVTAKIVSQLTGDADFSSPEALVAFALAMTLFVITLALNILALWVVRTYREQYE